MREQASSHGDQPSAEPTDLPCPPKEEEVQHKEQDTGVLLPAPHISSPAALSCPTSLLSASPGYQAGPSGTFITHLFLSLQQVLLLNLDREFI